MFYAVGPGPHVAGGDSMLGLWHVKKHIYKTHISEDIVCGFSLVSLQKDLYHGFLMCFLST